VEERRSRDFQDTSLVHGSSAHHAGTVPDFETLVTDAPDSMSVRQTREPTKPVPPTTVILGLLLVEDEDIMEIEVVVTVHAVVVWSEVMV